jgi:hypothetical protein
LSGQLIDKRATGCDCGKSRGAIDGLSEHSVFGASIGPDCTAENVTGGNANRHVHADSAHIGLQFKSSEYCSTRIIFVSVSGETENCEC